MRAALYRFIPPRGGRQKTRRRRMNAKNFAVITIRLLSLLRPEQLRRDRRHDFHALDEIVDGDMLV